MEVMFGGLVAIGTAAIILFNYDRIVAKTRKSNSFAWVFALSGVAVIVLAAQLFLQGGQ
jgi:hypothetical protein